MNKLGSLDAGKRADIVTVSGDPMTDMRQRENVSLVIKDGYTVKSLAM